MQERGKKGQTGHDGVVGLVDLQFTFCIEHGATLMMSPPHPECHSQRQRRAKVTE